MISSIEADFISLEQRLEKEYRKNNQQIMVNMEEAEKAFNGMSKKISSLDFDETSNFFSTVC